MCLRMFGLKNRLQKACGSSSLSLCHRVTCPQEQRWLHIINLPYILQGLQRVTFFSSLVTHKPGRPTHHCMSSSRFSGAHWACSVLSSCSRAVGILPAFSQLPVSHPGLPAGLTENNHKSHQWLWVRAHPQKTGTFPLLPQTFTESELAGSQQQLMPVPATAKAIKSNRVNNFQE